HVQTLRHASDAIMVGVGTVIADDPLLTDRTGAARRRPLLRVVLDSSLRLSLHSKLVQTANNDVLVLCTFAEESRRARLEAAGVQVAQVKAAGSLDPLPPNVKRMPVRRRTGTGKPIVDRTAGSSHDGRPDLQRVMRLLGEMEITSLLIEGGASVNWAS